MHFTLTYFRLSYTLAKLFTTNLNEQIAFLKPDEQQRAMIKLYMAGVAICVLSFSCSFFVILGAVCLSNGAEDPDPQHECMHFIMGGFIAHYVLKLLLSCV